MKRKVITMKELEKKINIFFTLTIALGILYLAHITSVYTIIQYQLYINLITLHTLKGIKIHFQCK